MQLDLDYQAALDYLYSFVDHSLTRNLQLSPDKFDLARMRAFAEVLGNPHQAYPIIHVAGTKGKGSVSALCASALQANGYRVGLYTSPHLSDYTERIQVDGQPIPQAELVSLLNEMRPAISQVPGITTFEITTALAMLYFARCQVNAAVFEVGLGGRLDATNIVTPQLAVITSISYDHMAVLGNTLAQIAGEKAGIIKPGVPVVISRQPAEAQQVFEQIASERHAPLVSADAAYANELLHKSVTDGQTFRIWPVQDGEPAGDAVELQIPLLGLHQVENAVTAYAALQTWRAAGHALDAEALRAGFARVKWPGRFEILRFEPPVVIDSAHNRHSALRLRQAVDDYFGERPVVLLFGASEDKDIQGMLSELLPRVRQVVFTQSFHPRAMDPAPLVAAAQVYGCPAKAVAGVDAALEEALHLAGEQALVLATGSLFVAAAVRDCWQARQSA